MSTTRLTWATSSVVILAMISWALLGGSHLRGNSTALADEPAGHPVSGQPAPGITEQPPAAQNCSQTECAGRCGTNLMLEPRLCGGIHCNGTTVEYGTLFNCISTKSPTSGVKNCCDAGDCLQIKRKLACEDGTSVVESIEITGVCPSTVACGETCSAP